MRLPLLRFLDRLRSIGSDRGQATAEYGLVLLAAAALAGALLAWATSSGGVARLMNAVMGILIGGIGGP